MDLLNWLLLICTALALVALTWWGSAWWYGRKLGELQARLDKTRQAASRHVKQAERQIVKLQQELVERPPRPAVQRLRDEAAAAIARRARLAQSLDEGMPSRLPAHGFADTQPL